ncbi:MAG TPA: hypothetical protein DCO82_05535, partial [Alphaproteobacteria bacterium]|nr:hypothetical protein [Alphaproteobacteria bacterium]
MAENSRPLNIRLGVKDQEVVARALRNLGKDGEAALKKLEKASADSSARMKAHRAAAQELNGVFQQMAQRAGPLAPLLSRMGAAGTIAAAGIGALSVGLKAAITTAAEAEKMQLRLGAVLRATGGAAGLSKQQLINYASELQVKLKISDETLVESMSVLATFRNISGDTFKQATELAADMALVFKTDLTAASKQLGLALNDPAAGMTALRRAGVSFTAEQKELIRTLQETGDLAGAQKIILQELVDEIGGSAAAEGRGLAGRTRGLALAWSDMLEVVGTTAPIQSATNAVIGLLEAVTEIAKPESTQELVAAQEKVVADLQKRLGTDYHFTAGRRRVAEAQEELRLLRQRLAVEELEATAAELKAGRIEKNRIAAQKAAQEEARAEKARKEGAAEAKRAAAEAARTAEREAEQRRDALTQIQENIDALDQETGNLKLNERERAAAVEIQKQEAVARKANIDLTADQIDATRKAALANFDLKESIEAKQKADQDAARAIEDAARKAEDEQKRRAEAAQKIWDNAAENIQDALAGSIRGAFDSNEEGFIKSFFSRMVDLAKDAAAQMAAALIIQPTLGAIGFPGIGGNAPASGGGVSGILGAAGNAASLGNFLRGGSSLFGLGGAQGGVARLLSTGSLSSVGPIAPGFGTAIGAALPVVGAAAAAIGLAKALGLGGKKSVGPNAGGQLLLGAGGFSLGPTGADNGGVGLKA